jgi:hypothetical protein
MGTGTGTYYLQVWHEKNTPQLNPEKNHLTNIKKHLQVVLLGFKNKTCFLCKNHFFIVKCFK